MGVVGFLLFSQSSPLRAQPTTASTLSTATVAATGLVTAVGRLYSSTANSSSQTSSTSSLTPYNPVPEGFDTSNYTVSDNAGFTDANGNFVLG